MTEPQDQLPTPSERRNEERRRHFTPLRSPERRSGFERRGGDGRGGILERLRDSDLTLAIVLAAINALNLIDLLLTFRLLGAGAVEGNPVMGALIGSDPVIALLVKVALVGVVSLVIWRQRRYRLILAAALFILVSFMLLTAYELRLLLGA